VLPQYDAKGKLDPEGAQGVRYTIEREVLVSPGRHLVNSNLPSEERQVTVIAEIGADARPHVMEFKPVYNGPATRRFGFRYGIVDMNAFLNGAPLPKCRK